MNFNFQIFIFLHLAIEILCRRQIFRIKSSGNMTATGGKLAADTFKDCSIATKQMNDGLKFILDNDLVAALSICGPIGSLVSLTLNMALIGAAENEKRKNLDSFEILSKELGALSRKVEKATIKMLAETHKVFFQEQLSFPARVLRKGYIELMRATLEEEDDAMKLEEEKITFTATCKAHRPMDIYIKMEHMLEKNSESILADHEFTDVGFESFKDMYLNVMYEILAPYIMCERLVVDKKLKRTNEVSRKRTIVRLKKIAVYLCKITLLLDNINANRSEQMWNIMPTKLQDWYERFRKEKNHEIAHTFAEETNAEYKSFGYSFAVGIYNNKDENSIYLDCKEESCLFVREKNAVIWIFRSKKCHNLTKLLPNKCLQFEMQLYSFYKNDFADTAAMITHNLKRKCKIQNAIGIMNYDKKLNGSSASEAVEFATTKKSFTQIYSFKTEKRHLSWGEHPFKRLTIYADCDADPDSAFDFFKEYCTLSSKFPDCTLTEKAWNLHRFRDYKPGKL